MTPNALIAKYDVPGPRYTSYPTVPYWQKAPTQEEWLQHLQRAVDRSRAIGQGASLYIHVPFCRSLCHYCGCNTFISRDTSVAAPYVDTLLKEWGLYSARVGRVRLEELHIGGGTPTYLEASLLERMLGGIFETLDVPKDAELSTEADPRTTKVDQLEVLARLGFRRLSLGIQDFDPVVQHAVNRHQTVDEVRTVTEAARHAGFTGVNYDLIYGLPKQTPKSIQETIDQVRKLRPDRIAFYGYAHVPWMKSFQRKFEDSDVPAGPAKRELYELGRALLLETGYREIGLDHFALEDDGLWKAYSEGRMHRNFMGYTDRSTMPMFAIGVSSIGDTWTAYAQNEKTVPEWSKRVQAGELPISKGHVLDEEDLVLRRHITDVMTRFETTCAAPLLREVTGRLAEMADDGLVTVDGETLRVTELGRPFVRNVCMAFDARLARQAPDRPLFSRTV
jgi:oxygen-independent coproporphyrinogen-3 oxidase